MSLQQTTQNSVETNSTRHKYRFFLYMYMGMMLERYRKDAWMNNYMCDDSCFTVERCLNDAWMILEWCMKDA